MPDRNLCSCQGSITSGPDGWTHDNGATPDHTAEPTLDPTIAYGIQLGDAIILTGIHASTAAEALTLTRAQHVPPHTDADITIIPMCSDHPDQPATACTVHQAACAANGHGELLLVSEGEPVNRWLCLTCSASITEAGPDA